VATESRYSDGIARSQPSTADGRDHTNCGPEVLIAAISFTVIRTVRGVEGGACHVWLLSKLAIDRRGREQYGPQACSSGRALSGWQRAMPERSASAIAA